VDAALARLAVRDGSQVVVLCAAETTLAPTGAQVGVMLVPGAWAAFKAGDIDRYLGLIARQADAALAEGARTVALAQASMAGAAQLCAGGTVLTSPQAGLLAAAGR